MGRGEGGSYLHPFVVYFFWRVEINIPLRYEELARRTGLCLDPV